jgi:outer membrane protein TolC
MANAEPLTPAALLKEVYGNHPAIKSRAAKIESAKELASVQGALANPRIGIMRENSGGGEGEAMGAMYSLSLSQEFMWPSRYGLMKDMQLTRGEAAQEEYQEQRLQIRKQAATAYYQLYTAEKILELLKAQKEALRQIAKISEVRRAAGQAPQQDEMKAHIELTKIEMELIMQEQEIAAMRAALNSVLNRDQASAIEMPKEQLPVPSLKEKGSDFLALARANSRMIKSQKAMLKETELAHELARTSYYPDFMLRFTKPVSGSSDSKNYAIELEMSIPLWFFTKETSQVSASSYDRIEAQERLNLTERDTEKEVGMLAAQIKALAQLLKVYDSALIPQAITTLNASRSAYSSGSVGFGELLDAERMLYNERIEYYRNLAKYVENIVSLEAVLGASISDFPFDEGARA